LLSHRDLPLRLLSLSLGCSALILACTLTYPFNNDNALFAYMSALLLEGRLPYIGSWDQNFPGILLIHTPQILLFGRSQLAFHVWDILIQLIGAYYLFRLGLRLGGRQAAFLAPVICAFYYVQQGLWMAGERDTYVSILLLAAIYHASDHYKLSRRAILAGVLLGVAMLFRPTFGLLVPCFLIYLLLERRKPAELTRFATGATIPVLILAVIYLLAGGLDEFYAATISFNTAVYIGQGSIFSFWEPVRFYLLVVPFAIYGLWSLYKTDRNITLLIALCFAAAIVSIILLYRHSVYHYHPAMTLFLLLGAIGFGGVIARILESARSRTAKLALQLASVTVVLGFFTVQTLRGNTIKTVLGDLFTGKIKSLDHAYSYYEGSPDFGVHVQKAVGEYLRTHTTCGDAVQMFGPYSYPQYYSHTSTASRFQTLHALTMRREGDRLTPHQTAWRREYLADLARVQPMYFIVCDAPDAFRQFYAGRLGHEILKDDMTEVGEWLAKNYLRDTVIGAFTIYALNEAR
jgi:hypothetical protein